MHKQAPRPVCLSGGILQRSPIPRKCPASQWKCPGFWVSCVGVYLLCCPLTSLHHVCFAIGPARLPPSSFCLLVFYFLFFCCLVVVMINVLCYYLFPLCRLPDSCVRLVRPGIDTSCRRRFPLNATLTHLFVPRSPKTQNFPCFHVFYISQDPSLSCNCVLTALFFHSNFFRSLALLYIKSILVLFMFFFYIEKCDSFMGRFLSHFLF